MTLQQQIRANRRRTAYVILAFAALIIVFAALFGFQAREFFAADQADRRPVAVSFQT